MTIQERIRKLISNNKTKEALDELTNWSEENKHTDLLKSVSILNGQFKNAKKKERLGIIGFSESLKEQAFVNNSLMDFAHEIDEGKINSNSNHEELIDNGMKTILFLASNPTNEAKLELEKEFTRIFSSLQEGVIKYNLKTEWAVTPQDLQKAMLKHKPNIVHFSGHGEAGVEDESQVVSGKAISNLFRIFSKRINIEIVLLNSCYSKDQAEGIREHIPYVVGMDDSIGDDSAIEFSTGFYRGLSENNDVDFAFELAVNAIELEGLADEDIPVLLKKRDE